MKKLTALFFITAAMLSQCMSVDNVIAITGLAKDCRQRQAAAYDHPASVPLDAREQTNGAFTRMGFDFKRGAVDTRLRFGWYAGMPWF